MRIFISVPYRSINFINQRTLIAGTQRLALDLMRLGRWNVNRVASFEWEFSKRNVQLENSGMVPVDVSEARRWTQRTVRGRGRICPL